ncbi:DUF192 domain-containing protein [Snuella sedimenti]|uniref:DUF192 domain-containing protein n=1 Tax=Snuella sedimenti TaxID=2798802 RepID=A0A8J7J125_9FLAO|nr:DUF192 domain-containing protein [Snuella sedimenti]MBJ6366944.1 DUF192 domain-containing protein [Snuella sedimenti]
MHVKSVIVLSFILCLNISIHSCKEGKKEIKQTEVHFKKEGELSIFKSSSDTLKVSLDIEIADTDYDIQTGLMYRNAMLNNQGMLFVFKDAQERYFYMKNTRFPLDIIYISDKNTIVSFQKNAKPFDETSLPSNAPAKHVLEVNAGLVDIWGLAIGDSIGYTK